jgi:hypothetical protein
MFAQERLAGLDAEVGLLVARKVEEAGVEAGDRMNDLAAEVAGIKGDVAREVEGLREAQRQAAGMAESALQVATSEVARLGQRMDESVGAATGKRIVEVEARAETAARQLEALLSRTG